MTYSGSGGCSRCGAKLAADNATGRCAACQAKERDRVAAAPDVPPQFWIEGTVQRALATRHMGRVIRAYRCHPYHGRHPLAQGVVAGWVGLTQAQLSRIETGPPIVHLDRLAHWARVLRIPPEYLWFKLPDDETEDMKRRSLLAMGGASLIGALAPPAAPLLDGQPGASTQDLAAAMLTPATGVEPTSVADLTRQVRTAWQLRQRAHYEALGQMLPPLLTRAEASAHAFSDQDQQDATRAVVHTYNAASSLLRKLGDGQLALVAADRAVHAARVVGDPVLIAAAMYRLANVLLSARRLDQTKTVALQAADLTEPGKARTTRGLAMWGGLLLTAAVAAARHGDESEAWELMGEARTGSRLLGDDHADLYSIFGPTNVAIHGVQVAVELRRGRDAVRRSHNINPDRLPDSLLERRGQFFIDVAHGYVLEHDDAAAVAMLLRADHIAPLEVRLSPEVHQLTRTLLSRERVGAALGLRELAGRIGLVE